MAGKRKTRTGKWEFVVKKAGVLPKPLYLTFETEAEGDAYCAKLEALLARGVVPAEHLVARPVMTIAALVGEYERDAHPSPKDRGAFGPVLRAHGAVALDSITAAWVDAWISEMKRAEKLAPATIRARVGALARCTDWGVRKGLLSLPDNALRNLPDGYAQYTKTDAALAEGARTDVERDRRLEPGEYERILAVIDAGVLPRKQRPRVIEYKAAVRCLFLLAVETAMRLREMFTLTIDQVDIRQRTVFLDKTKNGDKRQVPLSSVALAALADYMPQREIPEGHRQDALFPWWNGDASEKALGDVSDALSKLFGGTRTLGVFEAAGCSGLRFHDLRHEAVSRLFERTTLSEVQIMRISGHKSHRMLMRYANLRGSDLAAALW